MLNTQSMLIRLTLLGAAAAVMGKAAADGRTLCISNATTRYNNCLASGATTEFCSTQYNSDVSTCNATFGSGPEPFYPPPTSYVIGPGKGPGA